MKPRNPPAKPTCADVIAQLRAHPAAPQDLQGMARFGINVARRIGWSIPALRRLAKQIGRDHALALALWESGLADARILAAFIAEPEAFTSSQMETWVRSFDSWDVCDQTCNSAFVGSPLAWRKVPIWARRKGEFERRAAFALLASLAVHDKQAEDTRFLQALRWIESAALDERNFVKKAVNWALRQIGKRNAALREAALACAARLRESDSRAARWVGNDAWRELSAR